MRRRSSGRGCRRRRSHRLAQGMERSSSRSGCRWMILNRRRRAVSSGATERSRLFIVATMYSSSGRKSWPSRRAGGPSGGAACGRFDGAGEGMCGSRTPTVPAVGCPSLSSRLLCSMSVISSPNTSAALPRLISSMRSSPACPFWADRTASSTKGPACTSYWSAPFTTVGFNPTTKLS